VQRWEVRRIMEHSPCINFSAQARTALWIKLRSNKQLNKARRDTGTYVVSPSCRLAYQLRRMQTQTHRTGGRHAGSSRMIASNSGKSARRIQDLSSFRPPSSLPFLTSVSLFGEGDEKICDGDGARYAKLRCARGELVIMAAVRRGS